MPYIANKPIRFDKNYKIGEVIPENVIEPKMIKRLLDWGKIIKVSFPDTSSTISTTDNNDSIDKNSDNKTTVNTENNNKNEKKSLNKTTRK